MKGEPVDGMTCIGSIAEGAGSSMFIFCRRARHGVPHSLPGAKMNCELPDPLLQHSRQSAVVAKMIVGADHDDIGGAISDDREE